MKTLNLNISAKHDIVKLFIKFWIYDVCKIST